MKFFLKSSSLILTFLITLGLAISLQSVFGINIGSSLNFSPAGNKITNVGPPVGAGDAATWDFVNTVASGKQNTITGSCPIGQGIRVVAANGTVTCESASGTAVLDEWNNSYGTFNTGFGGLGDHRLFTVPAGSGGVACSYFGGWSYCNGCSTLSFVTLVCSTGSYSVPLFPGTVQDGRIQGHSPVFPGSASQINCTLSVVPQGVTWQPTVGINGMCHSV